MAALIDALNSFRIDSIGTIQFCQDHYNFRWCFVGNIVSDFQSGKNTLQQQQLKLIVMQKWKWSLLCAKWELLYCYFWACAQPEIDKNPL